MNIEYRGYDLESRFKKWVKIDIESNCWIWIGSTNRNKNGYGRLSIGNGKRCKAHRISMHLYKNFDLDSKEQINHINECHNTLCVNPDHLYIGTQKDNMYDRSVRIRNKC